VIPEIPEAAKALIGISKVRRVQVTERDIRRFAQAIGEAEPVKKGQRGLIAPPLFYQTLSYEEVPAECLPPDGSPVELDVPIPARRTVGGSSEYEVYQRAEAGDQIDVSTRLKDVSVKQGRSGVLYCVVVETEFCNLAGQRMAKETATYLKRL
jgi:hydroxyacyl-ACP dehydratase HTD2-like protein with hotdog domain